MGKQPNFFERNPKKTLIMAVIAGVLLLDIFCANAYKLKTGYSLPEKAMEEQARIEKIYRIPSAIYHHTLAENKSIDDTRWGHKKSYVRTNSFGFRDRIVRDVPLKTGKYRVLFIGDSFTEGIGLEYKDTFVGIIDEALSKKGIETLNASATSYSPIIYWRKLKYLIEDRGLEFNELVVFLDISDTQDEAEYYFLDEAGNVGAREIKKKKEKDLIARLKRLPDKIDDIIKDNFLFLYAAIKNSRDLIFKITGCKKYAVNLPRGRWTIDEELFNGFGKTGMEKMELYMDKVHTLASSHNIKMTVAVYPWPDQIMSGDLNSIHVTFWRDWCDKNNLEFINYFPYFVKGDTEKDRARILDEYFIPGDVHWNEKAHKLIANVFLCRDAINCVSTVRC
ncbi:MAG: hypothetical protein ABH844_04010 [Candidatus Omnitrophota bacterium]